MPMGQPRLISVMRMRETSSCLEMAANFEAHSTVPFYLQDLISTISEDVLKKRVEHKIDHEVFLGSICVPLLGDRYSGQIPCCKFLCMSYELV